MGWAGLLPPRALPAGRIGLRDGEARRKLPNKRKGPATGLPSPLLYVCVCTGGRGGEVYQLPLNTWMVYRILQTKVWPVLEGEGTTLGCSEVHGTLQVPGFGDPHAPKLPICVGVWCWPNQPAPDIYIQIRRFRVHTAEKRGLHEPCCLLSTFVLCCMFRVWGGTCKVCTSSDVVGTGCGALHCRRRCLHLVW